MRAFIAINLPQEIKDSLETTIKGLDKINRGTKINWTKPENLHLTLHFLDEIDENQAQIVSAELEKIAGEYQKIQMSLGSIGAFPDVKNPRVIFIGVQSNHSRIIEKIQKKIGYELKRLGFKIDLRPYEAHVTLGRVKAGSVKLDLEASAGKFEVDSIELMKSTLTPSGPIYEVIKSFEFR
ncbi:MAG: RNA 2',3'-cyclic phosphodiesterase [Patescibacteria group bacterium]